MMSKCTAAALVRATFRSAFGKRSRGANAIRVYNPSTVDAIRHHEPTPRGAGTGRGRPRNHREDYRRCRTRRLPQVRSLRPCDNA